MTEQIECDKCGQEFTQSKEHLDDRICYDCHKWLKQMGFEKKDNEVKNG